MPQPNSIIDYVDQRARANNANKVRGKKALQGASTIPVIPSSFDSSSGLIFSRFLKSNLFQISIKVSRVTINLLSWFYIT